MSPNTPLPNNPDIFRAVPQPADIQCDGRGSRHIR